MTAHIEWRRLAQLGPFHWHDVQPRRAARVAFGVVVPLGLGWATGHVGYGAYAALGALPAGTASFEGETRSRVAIVVAASIGMAVSTFVGATTAAAASWLLVPVVALWGYFTGLGVALGPRFSTVVLQWSIALLIATLPLDVVGAALRAGLVLAGGLLQAVLVAASWTLRPGVHERAALAASYRSLADYASGLAAGASEGPPPTAFAADARLDDPNPLLPLALRPVLLSLLEQGERIRGSLAALAVQATDGEAGPEDPVRRLMANVAKALHLIAAALNVSRAERAGLFRELSGKIDRLTVATEATWRWAGEAILGQLRATARILATLETPVAQPAARSATTAGSSRRSPSLIAAAVATLRANVGIRTEAGRHALRLAVIAALAEVFVQATGLYQGRWVTITIFLVLKPDYASTLYRGVQCAAGTVLGAGASLAASELAQLTPARLVAAAAACIAVAYALFDVSFLIFSVFLTGFILALLDLLGTAAVATAEARLINIFMGSGLALLAYFAWPTWEGATAQEKFARLVETHAAYATALLGDLAHPGGVDAAQLRALQAAARRARSDAEAAAARLSVEPAQVPLTPELAQLLMATVARIAHAELALHTLALSQDRRATGTAAPGAQLLEVFREALVTALNRLASAVRSLKQPEPIPTLGRLHAALREAPALRDTALVVITDWLADSADTLDSILRQRLPER